MRPAAKRGTGSGLRSCRAVCRWENRRVTVNLAPTGMRKSGGGLDLPIAVALLVAAKMLRARDIEGMAFIGELGLDGSIRAIPGVLSMVDAVRSP